MNKIAVAWVYVDNFTEEIDAIRTSNLRIFLPEENVQWAFFYFGVIVYNSNLKIFEIFAVCLPAFARLPSILPLHFV